MDGLIRAVWKLLRFDGFDAARFRIVAFDHAILRHRRAFPRTGVLRLRRLRCVVISHVHLSRGRRLSSRNIALADLAVRRERGRLWL